MFSQCCIHTENQNQASFSPFGLHEISVLIELTLGHLRYFLTDVPPQPNSPSKSISCVTIHLQEARTSSNNDVAITLQHK